MDAGACLLEDGLGRNSWVSAVSAGGVCGVRECGRYGATRPSGLSPHTAGDGNEQEQIDTARRLLCMVQQAYPAELPDPVCTLLESGRVQFVTNAYMLPYPLRRYCALGETTPIVRPSPAVESASVTYQMLIRRDRLPSSAKTFLTLAHEGTHATSTPLRYHFAADRYGYERCLDDNAIRDNVVAWGSRARAFLRATQDTPPPWLADAPGIASLSGTATANWSQRREALISEIEQASRQAPKDADNAHLDCTREAQNTEPAQP